MVACTRLAAKVSRKTILFHDGLEQSVKDAFIHFLETQNVRLVRDDFVENQLHASLFLEKFLGTIGIDGHLVVFEGILIRQYVVRNDPYIRIRLFIAVVCTAFVGVGVGVGARKCRSCRPRGSKLH